ncbi:Helix-turn-helix domain-containing protein [Paenimyroides aquimaris]|uniref:Helix-turn-helix domain-containing protein n=1 Tax=Paenimyroides marinum TaxID=1159016 RepID=A0A1H6MMS7_9FLAO|nr:helix-turn-helix transcriptional regulator [Paenimyroides aquimaris]SEI03121.1 Helix-turn-helix domain-containing protein [Paenimyroides aquimaris]
MIYHNFRSCFFLEIAQMTVSEEQFLKKLGARIAKLRKEKGFSQLDICAEIKMEKSNLSSIENGRQNVTSLYLYKIANAIGVEIKEFFQ